MTRLISNTLGVGRLCTHTHQSYRALTSRRHVARPSAAHATAVAHSVPYCCPATAIRSLPNRGRTGTTESSNQVRTALDCDGYRPMAWRHPPHDWACLSRPDGRTDARRFLPPVFLPSPGGRPGPITVMRDLLLRPPCPRPFLCVSVLLSTVPAGGVSSAAGPRDRTQPGPVASRLDHILLLPLLLTRMIRSTRAYP